MNLVRRSVLSLMAASLLLAPRLASAAAGNSTIPSAGTAYTCDSETRVCECWGTQDCLKLGQSRFCTGTVKCGANGCTCTWDPPIGAAGLSPKPPSHSGAIEARPGAASQPRPTLPGKTR